MRNLAKEIDALPNKLKKRKNLLKVIEFENFKHPDTNELGKVVIREYKDGWCFTFTSYNTFNDFVYTPYIEKINNVLNGKA